MVHRLPFIAGVVMLVVAGTLTFVATSGDESGHMEAPAANRVKGGTQEQFRETGASSAWQQDSQAGSFRPEIAGKSSRLRPSRADVASVSERDAPPQLRTDLKVQVKPGHPRHAELEASAGRVESFARRQLAQLTRDLDLTTDQQTRIFPILARGAKSYDPGMQIVDGRGSNGKSTRLSEEADTTTTAPLNPEQQQELLQEELDLPQAEALVNLSERDLMIWEELIGDLTRQLDRATPGQVAEVTPTPSSTPTPPSTPAAEPEPEREVTGGTSGPSTPTTEPPATGSEPVTPPESHGGRNLFDLIPGG